MASDTANTNRDEYRLPTTLCASCGQPTGGSKNKPTGYGAFHYDCARDEQGRLVVKGAK